MSDYSFTVEDQILGKYNEHSQITQFIGQKLPETKTQTWFNSKALTLKQLEGQVVILDFWAHWCKACIKEIPYIQQLWEKYQKNGLTIIGIHSVENDYPKVEETINSLGITFPVTIDESPDNQWKTSKIYGALGITGIPQQWLIDRSGHVRVNTSLDQILLHS